MANRFIEAKRDFEAYTDPTRYGLVRTWPFVLWEWSYAHHEWRACGSFDTLAAASRHAVKGRVVLPMGQIPTPKEA